MRTMTNVSIGALALITGLLLAPTAARADGFIIIERPPRPAPHRHEYFPLAVKNHDVTVTIRDGVAVTEVDQTFWNPNPTQLEGTYMFPLPDDAAVSKFSMFMDGKEVEGEVLDRERARTIYEGIVRKMQDPALLEYMGRGMFRARIFPIPARGEKRIKLSYSQVLGRSGTLTRYSYPLNTEKFSSAPLSRCVVRTTIHSSGAPIRSVYSPTHPVEVVRTTDGEASALYERHDVRPDKDFVLYYSQGERDVELSLMSFRDADGAYFVALVSPYGDDDVDAIPKDVAFVFDTSGSMAGEKLTQAKAALGQAIGRLGPDDRFAILDFSTEVRSLSDTLLPADAESRTKAQSYVANLKARGGTAIHDALTRALGFGEGNGRPFFVVFVTDGQPTIGPSKPEEILAAAKAKRRGSERIFVLGVGEDVNTNLLDRLAEENRGDRDYVLPGEELEVKVSAFIDKVAFPVLADASVSFEGAAVRDVYPKQVGDLFRGSQVVITGRYRDDGAVAIRVRGTRGGKKVETVVEGKFAAAAEHEFASRLWAKRKIGYLLDQMRAHGESGEVRDEIIFLAKKFGIVTPYTSYLVLEDEPTAAVPSGENRHRGREGDDGSAPDGVPNGRRFAGGGGLTPSSGSATPGPVVPPASPGDRAFTDALREHARRSKRAEELQRGLKESSGKDSLGAARVAGALRKLDRPDEDAEAEKGGYRYDDDGRYAQGQQAPGGGGGSGEGRSGRGAWNGSPGWKKPATTSPTDPAGRRGEGRTELLEAGGSRALVHRIGARTFYRQGERWVDAAARETTKTEDEGEKKVEVVRVVYLSDEYFELCRAEPELAACFTLGARVEVMHGGKLYRVVPK